jgi:DNA-directed RNA polymerase subunit RPC12/RpoP
MLVGEALPPMDPLFIIFLALLIPGLLTLALIVAVALPRAVRDENRLNHNLCMNCGYDLCASTGGPCPECGHRAFEPAYPPVPHEPGARGFEIRPTAAPPTVAPPTADRVSPRDPDA